MVKTIIIAAVVLMAALMIMCMIACAVLCGRISREEEEAWDMNTDKCICCGKPIPEGRQICYRCEHEFD